MIDDTEKQTSDLLPLQGQTTVLEKKPSWLKKIFTSNACLAFNKDSAIITLISITNPNVRSKS
jgi:hypothetical protein